MTIQPYTPAYRDDMLFCYLSAKDALGVVPTLRDDLLDIEGRYFAKGDMFWLAVAEGRVVGMVGTDTVSPTDLWLKRLFVKPGMKRRGVGSALLGTLEAYAGGKGVATLHTRFGDSWFEAARFYAAKGFAETERHGGLRHFVKHLAQE